MKTKELDTIFISWNFLFALFSTFIIVQSITIGDFNKLKPLGQSMNYRGWLMAKNFMEVNQP